MAVITISRQSGSEGNTIALMLSERLGYQILDKTLMAEVAKSRGWDPNQFEDITDDKHLTRSNLEKILSSIRPPFGSLSENPQYHFEDYEKFTGEMVQKILNAAYERGNVIIVGRGGQVALAQKPNVIHLRVVASEEKRVRTWRMRDKLSLEEAQKRIRERDKAHTDFVRSYFGANINDCSLYDLVINTDKITPADATETVIVLLRLMKLVPSA